MRRHETQRDWGAGYNVVRPPAEFLAALTRYDQSLAARWCSAKQKWEIGTVTQHSAQFPDGFCLLFECDSLGEEVFACLDRADLFKDSPKLWIRRYLDKEKEKEAEVNRRADDLAEEIGREVVEIGRTVLRKKAVPLADAVAASQRAADAISEKAARLQKETI